MKKLVLTLGMLLLAQTSLASTYACRIDQLDDWAVEINLETQQAALFDNNEWQTLPLARNEVLLGISGKYIFAGKTQDGDRVMVTFDTGEHLGARHTFYMEMGNEPTELSMDCQFTSQTFVGLEN